MYVTNELQEDRKPSQGYRHMELNEGNGTQNGTPL